MGSAYCLQEMQNNSSGNHKSHIYKKLADKMMTSLQEIDANRSKKRHSMHNHQDMFSTESVDISEDQGERFHHEIKVIEAALKCAMRQKNDGRLLLEPKE